MRCKKSDLPVLILKAGYGTKFDPSAQVHTGDPFHD